MRLLLSALFILISVPIPEAKAAGKAVPKNPLRQIVKKATSTYLEQCALKLQSPGMQQDVSLLAMDILKSNLQSFENPLDRLVISDAHGIKDPVLGKLTTTGRANAHAILTEKMKLGDFTKSTAPFLAEVLRDPSFGRHTKGPQAEKFQKAVSMSRWNDAIAIYDLIMPSELKKDIEIQQKLALALTKRFDRADQKRAEEILLDLIKTAGPSGETYGLLGALYKKKYRHLVHHGDPEGKKAEYLEKAIFYYEKGMRSDVASYYTGINFINLLLEKGTPESLKKMNEILPVVKYWVDIVVEEKPDYWSLATLLELHVLLKNWDGVEQLLPRVFKYEASAWMLETTQDSFIEIFTKFEKLQKNYHSPSEGAITSERKHMQAVVDTFSLEIKKRKGDENRALESNP